jgi:hypothetical protein
LEDASDSDIFTTSVVPLRLYPKNTSGDKLILWKNPRPSSVRYCPPIRIEFKKETAELAKEETSVVEESVQKLEKTDKFGGTKECWVCETLHGVNNDRWQNL